MPSPLATQSYIKGVLLYPMLVYWDQTTLRKQIPIWSNWLWAKTHSRFNKLLICKSNLIYIQDSTNSSWPSKGEGYKNETMLNKSHVTTSGQCEEDKGRRWELKHFLTRRVAEVNAHAYKTHVSWVIEGGTHKLLKP